MALAAAPQTWASEPSGSDTNGRAIFVVCPDGFGGAEAPANGPAPDCQSLAQALDAAVNNGVPDDLILLKPGYYCPVDLPNTYGRLYLQGIPFDAFPTPGDVYSSGQSLVENVTFSSFANDHCGTIADGAILRAAVSTGFVFLSNLSVDGADTGVTTPTSWANYGILLDQQNSYVRDVVVKRARVGLKIAGGTVSHSAFVKNLYEGVETASNRPTWISDTLIADTTGGTSLGIGYFDGTQSGLQSNSDTLVNVTITGNDRGMGRYPSVSNPYANVRNSLIAGNGADCDYYFAGGNGQSFSNIVGSSCYGLSVSSGSRVIDESELLGFAGVTYAGGLEPFFNPTLNWPSSQGDPNYCAATDQVERFPRACVVGSVDTSTAVVPPGGSDPISNYISFPSQLDAAPVQPGETASATASFSNLGGGYVTVSDVAVTSGFTVTHDDCSLGYLLHSWNGPGGEAAQAYCAITVSATPSAPLTGTLTVTTNHGVITIPVSASIAEPPIASHKPTISGNATVGSTVTAVPGAWASGAAFTYQWLRNGSEISGATGVSYKAVAADRGKALSVAVTGSKAGYTSVTQTSAGVTVGYGTLMTAKPTISGTAKVGRTLTAKPGAWTSGTAFTYQWLRNGASISGATKVTYVPTASDRGKKLTVRVKGTLSGYTSVTATSASVTVGYGTITTAKPTITGTAKVGKKLTAHPGTWKAGAKKPTLKYQWYASGAKISGATKSTYTLKSAQAGKKITVKVTGSASGYTSVSKTSAATGAVKKK